MDRVYDDLVVVDEVGRCLGVVRVGDLIRSLAEMDHHCPLRVTPTIFTTAGEDVVKIVGVNAAPQRPPNYPDNLHDRSRATVKIVGVKTGSLAPISYPDNLHGSREDCRGNWVSTIGGLETALEGVNLAWMLFAAEPV